MIESDHITSSAARTPKARAPARRGARRPTVRPIHVASIAVAPCATTSSCSGMPIGAPYSPVGGAARFRSPTAGDRCEGRLTQRPPSGGRRTGVDSMMTVTEVPGSDRHAPRRLRTGAMLLAIVDVAAAGRCPAIRDHALDAGADAARMVIGPLGGSSAADRSRGGPPRAGVPRPSREPRDRPGSHPQPRRAAGDRQGVVHRPESVADALPRRPAAADGHDDRRVVRLDRHALQLGAIGARSATTCGG